MSNELMNTAQAAKELDVSTSTIKNWITTKDLPAIRVGRQYVISRQQLYSWLETAQRRFSDCHGASVLLGRRN